MKVVVVKQCSKLKVQKQRAKTKNILAIPSLIVSCPFILLYNQKYKKHI